VPRTNPPTLALDAPAWSHLGLKLAAEAAREDQRANDLYLQVVQGRGCDVLLDVIRLRRNAERLRHEAIAALTYVPRHPSERPAKPFVSKYLERVNGHPGQKRRGS
jgi:hypothetical protein